MVAPVEEAAADMMLKGEDGSVGDGVKKTAGVIGFIYTREAMR